MSDRTFCYQLFEEMRSTDRLIKDVVTSICQKHGLSTFASFVLGDLRREEGQTFKELAARCSIKPSNFTPLFNFLKKKGYVERRQDEKDRRTFRLYLTDEGKELADAINEEFVAAFGGNAENAPDLQKQVFEGFSAIRSLIDQSSPYK